MAGVDPVYFIVQIYDNNLFFKKEKTIVSSKWLNQSKKNVITRYPQPPYDDNFLKDFLISHAQPPESWASYSCSIASNAIQTYNEAIQFRNQNLSVRNHAVQDLFNLSKPVQLTNFSNSITFSSANDNNFDVVNNQQFEQLNNKRLRLAPITVNQLNKMRESNLEKRGELATKEDLEVMKNDIIKAVTAVIESSKQASPADPNVMPETDFKRKVVKIETDSNTSVSLLKDLVKEVDEIKTFSLERRPLCETKEVMTRKQFLDLCKIELPFTTKEDFQKFNENLGKSSELTDYVFKFIVSTVYTNQDVKSQVRKTMKTFFKRQVLDDYTAQRQTGNKKVFRATHFYKHMLAGFLEKYKENGITEGTILTALGQVFLGCKDWDGGRKERELEKANARNGQVVDEFGGKEN